MCIVFGYNSGQWSPTARGSCARDSGAVIGLARLWWLTEFFTHMTTISLFKFVARFYTVGCLSSGLFSKQSRIHYKDVQKQKDTLIFCERTRPLSLSDSSCCGSQKTRPLVLYRPRPFPKRGQSSRQHIGAISLFTELLWHTAFMWPSFYLTWFTVKCNMWMQNYFIPRDVKGFRCRSWY